MPFFLILNSYPVRLFYAVNKQEKNIIARPVHGDDDFWLVRNFLIETYPITPPAFNWDVRRWDGSFFHNEEPGWDARFGKNGEKIRLWETGDGILVGVANPEGDGCAFLQLHPDYRYVEEEMIVWVEENLSKPTDDNHHRLVEMLVWDYDIFRQRILEKRGFEKTSDWEVFRRLRLGNKHIPKPEIADGYIMRTTRADDFSECQETSECQKTADLFNAAFRRTIHTASEINTFWTKCPCYRRDLELVAEAPDGSFAALIGMMYDEKNRFGLFEPVCTHPDHRRKGLASTLLYEGIHRVKALGAEDVYVGTGDMVPANSLYESVGFTEVYKGHVWRKTF
jgi:mycothiol synthase